MAFSQNGYPGLLPTSSKLYTWTLSDGRRLRGHNGSTGLILMHFAERFDRKIEDIDRGPLDDWMYAYRAVRGYSILSNHASGTAIDLNATQHPLGKTGTFTTKEIAGIDRILGKYDGCIRPGLHYKNRVDAMHFEIDKPLADCERVARSLITHNNALALMILANNPGQRKVIFS